LQQALTTLQQESHSLPFGLASGRFLGRGCGSNRPIVIRAWMVRCLSELGAFADGVAYRTEMTQLAEAVDRPYDYLQVYRAVGYLHLCQGTLHQTISLLERGVALMQEVDMAVFYDSAAAHLALAYALAGRATDALRLLGRIEGNFVVRGEAYLFAGEAEAADRIVQRGLAHARDRNMRGEEARALWLLGEIAMRRDPPDMAQAEAYYHHALALAEELDMRPLQAHCHLGLGTLYSTTGQRQLAQAELSKAIEMYRAMDMTLWLHQADAALTQIGKAERPAGGIP
jgi:tetratricopeptide (TPR) repeat protein